MGFNIVRLVAFPKQGGELRFLERLLLVPITNMGRSPGNERNKAFNVNNNSNDENTHKT